jgi:F-type H+-transporting ATPase subunit a
MADPHATPADAHDDVHAADAHGHAADAHGAHDAHGDAHHAHDPLDAAHLIGHVKDATYFEFPRFMGGKVEVPQFYHGAPVATLGIGFKPIDDRIEPFDLKVTKFMVLEAIVALLMILIFSWLALRLRRSDRPKGALTNFFESMIVFIRDDVARPAIGHHDADKFMPYLLTIFFFVLGCNLFGMLPWMGSATGALATTGALAFLTLCTVCISGMAKLGPVGFWVGQVPHMDLPLALAILLKPMIFLIEVMGMGIKHFILAMRLLANMMAGHLVLAVIMAFIAASAASVAWYAVTPASLLGAVALSLLELFVAFLQAYIFTFLSALFIGMAVHPH